MLKVTIAINISWSYLDNVFHAYRDKCSEVFPTFRLQQNIQILQDRNSQPRNNVRSKWNPPSLYQCYPTNWVSNECISHLSNSMRASLQKNWFTLGNIDNIILSVRQIKGRYSKTPTYLYKNLLFIVWRSRNLRFLFLVKLTTWNLMIQHIQWLLT